MTNTEKSGNDPEQPGRQERHVLVPADPTWAYLAGKPDFYPLLIHTGNINDWSSFLAKQGVTDFDEDDLPDGIVELGGGDFVESMDHSQKIAYKKDGPRVRLVRSVTEFQAFQEFGQKHSPQLDNYWKFPRYFISRGENGVVIAADIHDLYPKSSIDQVINDSKHAGSIKPLLPTLDMTIDTAGSQDTAKVKSVKVPVIDESGKVSRRWHLVVEADIPGTGQFDPAGEWTESDEAIKDLLEDPLMRQALFDFDSLGWSVAEELENYGIRKTASKAGQRLFKGAIGMLFGGAVLGHTDPGTPDGNDASPNIPTIGNNIFSDNSPEAANGNVYADSLDDPKFGGRSVKVWVPGETGSTTVNFSTNETSTGFDNYGNRYYMNSNGDVYPA